MIDFTDLLQQMAVRGDEVTVGDPDGIRRLGDRRRRRTTARWAVTVTVLILAGGTWLVGSDLDHSSTAPPVSHLTPPPTTPSSTTGSTWNAQPLKPPLMFGRNLTLGQSTMSFTPSPPERTSTSWSATPSAVDTSGCHQTEARGPSRSPTTRPRPDP